MSESSLKEWLVILNPHAGGGKGSHDKQKLFNLLEKQRFKFKLVTSDYPEHTIELTIKYISLGYRNIIVAGGDGTLNEVVNGVFLQKVVAAREIKVGMLPVGTGNDWTKTFGVPSDYGMALNIIEEGKVVYQDIGKISYTLNNEKKERFFANMAGFGFDAMVAAKANKLKEKGKSGLFVYLNSLIASYIKYRTCKSRIVVGDEEINDLIFSASVGIGKFNGGGMMQAPLAIPNNGEFQVTVIKKIGFWGIVRNLAGLYSGTFIKDRRVSVYNTNKVIINGESVIPGEADGETLGNSTFVVEVLARELQVIYGDDKFFERKNRDDDKKESEKTREEVKVQLEVN